MRNKRTFTLIELLVVIAIIAVLVGILLPVVSGARKKAMRVKTSSEINALRLAVSSYRQTYQYLPWQTVKVSGDLVDVCIDGTSDSSNYDKLIKMLTGNNPRKTAFLDVTKSDDFEDPWERNYNVVFDTNYDSEIVPNGTKEVYDLSGSSKQIKSIKEDEEISAEVFIWSDGPKTGSSSYDDDVFSINTEWDAAAEEHIPTN